MKINYSELYIRNILEKVNTIAVIGASPTKTRDSYKVMEALIQNGYEIFPVNPKEAGNLILGKECYSDIKDIEKDIDLVDIFREKRAVMDITIQGIGRCMTCLKFLIFVISFLAPCSKCLFFHKHIFKNMAFLEGGIII